MKGHKRDLLLFSATILFSCLSPARVVENCGLCPGLSADMVPQSSLIRSVTIRSDQPLFLSHAKKKHNLCSFLFHLISTVRRFLKHYNFIQASSAFSVKHVMISCDHVSSSSSSDFESSSSTSLDYGTQSIGPLFIRLR